MDANKAKELFQEKLFAKYYQLTTCDIPRMIRDAISSLKNSIELDITHYPDELILDLKEHLKEKQFIVKIQESGYSGNSYMIIGW